MFSVKKGKSVSCSSPLALTAHVGSSSVTVHACFPEYTQLFPSQHTPVVYVPSVDSQHRRCVTVQTNPVFLWESCRWIQKADVTSRLGSINSYLEQLEEHRTQMSLFSQEKM